jgi:hypothetical protein
MELQRLESHAQIGKFLEQMNEQGEQMERQMEQQKADRAAERAGGAADGAAERTIAPTDGINIIAEARKKMMLRCVIVRAPWWLVILVELGVVKAQIAG